MKWGVCVQINSSHHTTVGIFRVKTRSEKAQQASLISHSPYANRRDNSQEKLRKMADQCNPLGREQVKTSDEPQIHLQGAAVRFRFTWRVRGTCSQAVPINVESCPPCSVLGSPLFQQPSNTRVSALNILSLSKKLRTTLPAF